ncbi:hypothetical protein VTK56DRAFT_3136 [Thermocarpiscus australiensis]
MHALPCFTLPHTLGLFETKTDHTAKLHILCILYPTGCPCSPSVRKSEWLAEVTPKQIAAAMLVLGLESLGSRLGCLGTSIRAYGSSIHVMNRNLLRATKSRSSQTDLNRSLVHISSPCPAWSSAASKPSSKTQHLLFPHPIRTTVCRLYLY